MQPRLLTPHPQLHQNGVRSVEATGAVGGRGQPARPTGGTQDPGREGADHLEPVAVRVQEHEFVDRERLLPIGQSAHELGV